LLQVLNHHLPLNSQSHQKDKVQAQEFIYFYIHARVFRIFGR
jgi:hypothetical protein